MTHQTINLITIFIAGIPWGLMFYGNIKLQRIGLSIQVLGLVIMIINVIMWK